MARTSVDLFRMGNATSARLDHVRPIDVHQFLSNGVIWVKAGTGGVSTFDRIASVPGRWWKLSAGYDYGGLLLVWNDHGHHWAWEPAVDMTLSQYTGLLATANLAFR